MAHKLLAGRYDVLRQLGGGGFGQTYLARDQHLPGKPFCVVKKLQPKVKSPEAWEAAKRLFEAEAVVLHALGHHDQIPHLTAHFEEARQFYLVQEYIPGSVLNQSFKNSLPLNEADAKSLVQEILTLLIFVHQNQVIHRDIKPSNLIRRESDRKIVLIDFGAVKQLTLSSIDDPAIIVGSSGYAPPEQLLGCSCFESDLYAIGMIGIQALTGYSPKHLQRDPESRELFWRDQADVSPEFAEVLDRLVRYDVNERYGCAEEVLEALQQSKSEFFSSLYCKSIDRLAPATSPSAISPSAIDPANAAHSPTDSDPIDRECNPDPSNIAWVERGDYLLQRQHFREAIAAYDRALHLQPEEATLWMKQGMAYDGIQQFENAIAAYQNATQHAPHDASVWLKLGVLLENLNRPEEALGVYIKVVELQPDNVWAWHDRGKVLETLGQPNKALLAYSRAVEIKPKFQLAVESRKRILIDQADPYALLQFGHYPEALVLAKLAYQRDPSNPRTLLTYGATLAKLQRYDEAIVILDVLLGSESDHAKAWLVRSDICCQRQDWEGALQDVERALRLGPQQPKTLQVKAQILESMGRLEDAITIYTQILTVCPDEPNIKEERSRCQSILRPIPNPLDEATEEDSTVISLPVMPQSPGVSSDARTVAVANAANITGQRTAAKIAAKLNHSDSQAAFAEHASTEMPAPLDSPNLLAALVSAKANPNLGSGRNTDQTGSWILRGPLLEKVRQKTRSLTTYTPELQSNLDNPEALKLRGDTLFGLGRYEDAISCYDRAIHNTPNEPKLWCSLASALMKLKRHREAIACFDRAIHLKPESHIPWYWRSRVLMDLKRYIEALRSLDHALANKPNFQPALRARPALERLALQQAG